MAGDCDHARPSMFIIRFTMDNGMSLNANISTMQVASLHYVQGLSKRSQENLSVLLPVAPLTLYSKEKTVL